MPWAKMPAPGDPAGGDIEEGGGRGKDMRGAPVARAFALWHAAGRVDEHALWPSFGRRRCCSSVVEHSLGKGEVDSSILSGSTSYLPKLHGAPDSSSSRLNQAEVELRCSCMRLTARSASRADRASAMARC